MKNKIKVPPQKSICQHSWKLYYSSSNQNNSNTLNKSDSDSIQDIIPEYVIIECEKCRQHKRILQSEWDSMQNTMHLQNGNITTLPSNDIGFSEEARKQHIMNDDTINKLFSSLPVIPLTLPDVKLLK